MDVVTIRRTTAVEQLPPPDSGAPSRFLVRLIGDAAGTPVTAWGECRLSDPAGVDQGWLLLTRALPELDQVCLPYGPRTDPLREVPRTMELLRKHAGSGLDQDASGDLRRVLLGVEMALLDLIARSAGVSLARLLSARPVPVPVTPPGLVLGDGPANPTNHPRRLDPTGPVPVQLGGNVAAAVQALPELVRTATGGDRAAAWWLIPGEPLTGRELAGLVAALTSGMRKRQLPSRIWLQAPAWIPGTRLATLQRRADRLLARRFRRSPGRELQIMATASTERLTELAALVHSGACRTIAVDAGEAGGWLATMDLVHTLLGRQPDLTVALCTSAPSGDLTFAASYQLAAALPGVACLRSAQPEAAGSPGTGGAAPWQPVGPGLGAAVQLPALIPDSYRYHHGPRGADPSLHGRPANLYPAERPTRFLGKNGLRSHLVEREALAHGLDTTRYTGTTFLARDAAGTSMIFGGSARSHASGACSFMISDQHKGAAHALLARAGAPVPEARVFSLADRAGAASFAGAIGYPVVVKPVSGTGGTAVTTNISGDAALAAAFDLVLASPRHSREDVIVERHLPGEVYRIIVNGGKVLAAAAREPASVTGDGARSVAELIIEKNRYRRENPRLRNCLVDRDSSVEHLRRSGLDLDHTPAAGERVFLSDRPYLRNGGDWVEVMEELHPTIAAAAVQAVAAIPELRFCGVDILIEDHRRPIDEQSVGICELNACPELVSPQYPLFGPPRPIARTLLAVAAARRGIALPDQPATDLAVGISVEGRALGNRYAGWFRTRAEQLAVTVRVDSAGDRRLIAVAEGETIPVSSLTSTAILGPRGSFPTQVTVHHLARNVEGG
jgi:D-alanine-D-alanine ligase-like ATP-grasp enzyme